MSVKKNIKTLLYPQQDSNDQHRVIIMISSMGIELLEEIDQSLSQVEDIINKKIPKETLRNLTK
jgi:hypothetical protein